MEDFLAFKAWFSESLAGHDEDGKAAAIKALMALSPCFPELMVEVSPLTAECPFSAYKDLQ